MNNKEDSPRAEFFGRGRELIIEPGRTEQRYWRDLWQYRELFQVLAWRDISVRYKQTVIGAAWALIRPFLTMVVFTVLFGKLASCGTTAGSTCRASGVWIASLSCVSFERARIVW